MTIKKIIPPQTAMSRQFRRVSIDRATTKLAPRAGPGLWGRLWRDQRIVATRLRHPRRFYSALLSRAAVNKKVKEKQSPDMSIDSLIKSPTQAAPRVTMFQFFV
jgi:hypothetical protein